MGQPHIVFVDDDKNIIDSLRRSFRKLESEWNIVYLDSAKSALIECCTDKPHILVTDLKMPIMSGIDLIRDLNENSRNTCCIVLTGTADLSVATNLMNTSNIFRFYIKPCAPIIIEEGIREAILYINSKEYKNKQINLSIGDDFTNSFPIGLVSVNKEHSIIYQNRSASTILSEKDGLFVGLNNTLNAISAATNKKLHNTIDGVLSNTGDGDINAISIDRPSFKPSFKLIVSKINKNSINLSQAMIFISDPERNKFPNAALLQQLYELTPSESKLVEALVKGYPVDKIGEIMGLREASVRTYIKRITSQHLILFCHYL